MKIACRCGCTILDHGSYKGHLIADEDLNAVLDAIDSAIERPNNASADARCMQVRQLINSVLRPAWQCRACGRLYTSREGRDLSEWAPAQQGSAINLFAKARD